MQASSIFANITQSQLLVKHSLARGVHGGFITLIPEGVPQALLDISLSVLQEINI